MSETMINLIPENESMLDALAKYGMALDHATGAIEGELLSIDGVINMILDEGLTKKIKDLVKRHGFIDKDQFIDEALAAKDGEEFLDRIKACEAMALKVEHDKILAHMPFENTQKNLFERTKE